MVSIIFKEIDFYQLFWLMCVYSVGGWVVETIVGIVRNKRFTKNVKCKLALQWVQNVNFIYKEFTL